MIRLSSISLFSTGTKLDSFCAKNKNKTFDSSPFPLSKILVALLIAFSAADKFFKRLYGPHTKRAKTRSRPYTSLFFKHECKIFKWRIIRSRKIIISFDVQKFAPFLCPSPTFGLCPLASFALATALLCSLGLVKFLLAMKCFFLILET